MPRDLADVLHYLIPGSVAGAEAPPERPTPTRKLPTRLPRPSPGPSVPIVGVPIGERDVVRAAFTWNLAVEVARLGAWAAVVAPLADRASALWPEESIRPMGVNVLLVPATNLEELDRGAREIARQQHASTRISVDAGGVVFVRIPPLWLRELGAGQASAGGTELLRWTLLFTSSEGRDLLESYGIAKLVTRLSPGARIGITVHGARRTGEAQAAFLRLAKVTRRRLSAHLTSYGLLVDDLHVYRAIVAQRPIGLVHPQSPAARSMRDVAELVLADARAAAHG